MLRQMEQQVFYGGLFSVLTGQMVRHSGLSNTLITIS